VISSSEKELKARATFCEKIGSILADKTSVIHWLVCLKCHLKNQGTIRQYADKCWWLLTRGGTIQNICRYNESAMQRILDEGAKPALVPPSMSYMQSVGDSLTANYYLEYRTHTLRVMGIKSKEIPSQFTAGTKWNKRVKVYEMGFIEKPPVPAIKL
jgi:hypothetical protein